MATPVESWYNFDKAEIRDLVIAVIALAFAFGWKFPEPATLGNWAGNFVLVLILVSVSVLVHEVVHRIVARKFHARVRSRLFLSSVVAMLIITIITGGSVIVAVPWAVTVIPLYFYRPGKSYPQWHLGPRETALIALAGPLANFALAVLAKLLVPSLDLVAKKLIFINASLAVFNLLPFLTLFPIMFSKMSVNRYEQKGMPHVEGEFVFFGSRALWAFTFAFVLIGSLCLVVLGAFASLIIAFIISAVLWVLWHYFVDFRKLEPPKPI